MQDGNPPQVLEAKNLAVGYGRSAIISDCNVTVGLGEVVCLVGPNGAGKSTLLKAIVGHNRILAGTITVDGTDVTRLAPHARVRQGIEVWRGNVLAPVRTHVRVTHIIPDDDDDVGLFGSR